MSTDAPMVLPERQAYFRELSEVPAISRPALLLFLLALATGITAARAAVAGDIPMWCASIVNGICLYFFFTIMHEALHRTVSSTLWLNEILGRLSLAFLIPGAPLEVARWVHLKHHGNTTCDDDPDNFMHHGPWWKLIWRWANFDVYYIVHFYHFAGVVAKRHTPKVIISFTVFALIVGATIAAGYGMELLWLWFIPSRIGLALVGFVFVFLPHYPADISAREDKFQATTIRLGWEWLLTPLMGYQNYHLIHHLYPNVPFYNYLKIWHLKYDELFAQGPAVQSAFGLMPLKRAGLDPVFARRKAS